MGISKYKPLVTLLFFGGMIMQSGTGFTQEINMSSIFVDQMVLQREQKVTIWRMSDPGTFITVEFTGETKTSKADSKGSWRIDLDPMTAKYNDEDSQMKISDVLVGEVWFAGGKSNMYRPFWMLIYTAKESKYELIGPKWRTC